MRCVHCLCVVVVAVILSGEAAATLIEVRSIDGSGNSLSYPTQGSAGEALLREAPAGYPGDASGTTIIEPPTAP